MQKRGGGAHLHAPTSAPSWPYLANFQHDIKGGRGLVTLEFCRPFHTEPKFAKFAAKPPRQAKRTRSARSPRVSLRLLMLSPGDRAVLAAGRAAETAEGLFAGGACHRPSSLQLSDRSQRPGSEMALSASSNSSIRGARGRPATTCLRRQVLLLQPRPRRPPPASAYAYYYGW